MDKGGLKTAIVIRHMKGIGGLVIDYTRGVEKEKAVCALK